MTKLTIDNETLVEAFKHLNYCQLAKNSLASKKYRNLIQTHRHSLALLYVDYIGMTRIDCDSAPTYIRMFHKKLSSEAIEEWVVRNNYSKQIPFEDQVANTEDTQILPNYYEINAEAYYKDPNHHELNDGASVFFAQVELNHDNWPAFQHFVRLVTDPFIYIRSVNMISQNDVLNLLTDAIKPDRSRLQCKQLTFQQTFQQTFHRTFQPEDNGQKSITWANNYVRCNHFCTPVAGGLNQDEALLDFFVNGAHCSPSINVSHYDISKVMDDFVEKFLELENGDEYQGVLSIEGFQFSGGIDVLKNNYAQFFVKEERHKIYRNVTTCVFEFVNNAIGKKLQLIVTVIYYPLYYCSNFSLKMKQL